VLDNFLEMIYFLPLNGYLLPLNSYLLPLISYLLHLNCHSLNELLKHLDAVSLLNLSLISCSEAKLRKSCRLIEQGVAVIVFFILDAERLSPKHISGMTTDDWLSCFLEALSFKLLFVKEFCEFSLELPPVDQIHHKYCSL
jgi:hypothetical protein